MADYLIAPQDEPAWHWESDDFLQRIRDRWPNARTGVSPHADDPMATQALIPFDPPLRGLGVALSNRGTAISLDPADPETAAEFAVWLTEQFPALDPPIHLFAHNFKVNIQLSPEITSAEISSALS